MSQVKNFVISEFTNPSGEIVFRVSGQLDGKRIRKNFTTRAEAEAERQILEVQRLQGETGIRPAITHLTEDQLREAEVVFLRLKDRAHSLTTYLEYALSNFRESALRKTFTDAVTDFIAAKEHEYRQDLISEPYLTRLKRELIRFKKAFPTIAVHELTSTALLAYLEAGQVAYKTFNNRRGAASALLKFALQRDWISTNPIAKIPARRVHRRRGCALTFGTATASELMAFVEATYPEAIPFFALCLFAGIRPCLRTGEILRLRPSHVNLDNGVIHIDSTVSKIREPREISIQPNLAAWLSAYPLEFHPIIPANLQHLREKVSQKFPLAHDVMRHTFISMHVAKFRSIGEAALQAGNSESIIRKHYLALKSRAEADAFFGIRPAKTSLIVQKGFTAA